MNSTQEVDVVILDKPDLDDAALNALYDSAWPHHQTCTFGVALAHCLTYVGAFAGTELVGFAKLAWDGDIHAFLLDPTVHPAWQRRGIGRHMVLRLVKLAKQAGMEWVHVDYEPHLAPFYRACGFKSTAAGLIRVGPERRQDQLSE